MGKQTKKILFSSSEPRLRFSDLTKAIDTIDEAISKDKKKLASIVPPKNSIKVQFDKAAAALKASDRALKALKGLHQNTLEVIKASNIAIASMKATIKENDADAEIKRLALNELSKIIEQNKLSLKANALAFNAVNELAFYDSLTGLPNRRLLSDRLREIIISNKRWSSYSAAIFIDLDKFKLLNDEFGHDVGDQLLISVGNRIKVSVRESDTVARYGGDEFVILLNKLNGNLVDARSEAEIVANKVLLSLNPPHKLNIHANRDKKQIIQYQCFASMGIAMFNGDIKEEINVLDWADEAMYWAKSEGGKTIRFYDAKNSTEQTLISLYEMATQNDIETSNHGIRTRQYVKTLAHRAQHMNLFPGQLNDQIIERFFKTTQLHDIGKTKIPYSIIHKKGELTPDESSLMKTHTTLGADILKEAKKQNVNLADFLNTAIEIAESHHEHWDGSGYPYGLTESKIPLAGRIMAIVDVYDALISKRSYKMPWSHESAVAEIISKSGTQFDPLLVEAFKREQENFRLISENARDN